MPEEVWTKIPAKLENQWDQFGPINSIKQVQTEMVRYWNIKPQIKFLAETFNGLVDGIIHNFMPRKKYWNKSRCQLNLKLANQQEMKVITDYMIDIDKF